MNTKEQGTLRFIIYKEKTDYVAVCLDLNIIEYGKNSKKLTESIKEAAESYLEAVRKKDLSDELLNQFAPEKYWKMWQSIQKKSIAKKTSIPSRLIQVVPNQPFYFSTLTQGYLHTQSVC